MATFNMDVMRQSAQAAGIPLSEDASLTPEQNVIQTMFSWVQNVSGRAATAERNQQELVNRLAQAQLQNRQEIAAAVATATQQQEQKTATEIATAVTAAGTQIQQNVQQNLNPGFQSLQADVQQIEQATNALLNEQGPAQVRGDQP